jgi:hypothetical protein
MHEDGTSVVQTPQHICQLQSIMIATQPRQLFTHDQLIGQQLLPEPDSVPRKVRNPGLVSKRANMCPDHCPADSAHSEPGIKVTLELVGQPSKVNYSVLKTNERQGGKEVTEHTSYLT